MTGAETAQVITSIASLVAAVFSGISILVSALNGRRLAKVADKVEEVHKATDGLTEKLVASEKIISKAEGKTEERAEVAQRKESIGPIEVVAPPGQPLEVTQARPKK